MYLNKFSDRLSRVKSGKENFCSVVSDFIDKIKSNGHLNAFIEIYEDDARAKAHLLDEKPKDSLGDMAGMVVGVKDLICLKGHKVQASSMILDGFISSINATVIDRLLDNDAIIIGRQNCDEFGMGSANENSIYGPVLNGLDNSKTSGGSSGGGAVAVQTGMCDVSLGTDTGGSIRQPAAYCGLVGIRPSYSRVSRYGLIEHASSFDTIGVLANDVIDCALVLHKIAGKDNFDNTVSHNDVVDYVNYINTYSSNKKYKIAYLSESLDYKNIQNEVRDNTWAVINKLKGERHVVDGVKFSLLEYLLPTYYILTSAEASSNLARYDGIKFGYTSKNADNIDSMYKNTRSQGFGKEVKKRILLGNFILSSDYYDSYYTKAQKVRRVIKDRTDDLFKEYDFIISPTTPSTAFKLGINRSSVDIYLEDLYTVHSPLVGLPCISIPNGKDGDGMPVGLQIMGPAFSEDKLFAFAHYLFCNN